MKTKDFIERVEALNFVVKTKRNITGLIGFTNENGETLISVNENFAYHFNTNYEAFKQLHLRDKRQLANIGWEYASTPLEERKEEKKYLVEIKTTDSTLHLWRATDGSEDTDLINEDRLTTGQRHFTKNEIESIDDRFMLFAIEVTP